MANVTDILFGSDPTPNIVSVEPGPSKVVLYRRTDAGVVREERPFKPWLIALKSVELPEAEWSSLDGSGFNALAVFPNWSSFQTARYRMRDQHIDHLAYASPAKQYLMRTGQTLFKGMTFQDLHKMQLDIETLGYNPDDPESDIILIALSDNRGLKMVLDGTEDEILHSLIDVVRDTDPDVIEGHNIYGFDIPYLTKRASMRQIRLELGRDGSTVGYGQERNCPMGGISRPFIPAYIYGRHIIDTLLSVQRYDVARGNLTSHALKSVAVTLGLSEPDRVYVPHEEIAGLWRSDPERLKIYAIQDALETRALSDLISPAEFYLTQMVPDSYSSVITTGTGEKINSIMVREYLRQGKAIPTPQSPRPVPGGYTDIKRTGLIEKVVKCDVESLYPNLMLSERIKPEADTLDIFLPALEELTKRRISAKKKSRTCKGMECAYWDGLQASFKILINSFYGYLGVASFHFNDYDAAERITVGGQKIIKQIVEELERTGSEIIEIDTDGVYFRPPENVNDEEAEVVYIEQINRILPKGIRLAHDGRYKLMLSLKMKNYILVGYEGEKVFRGSSLRSRADERFGREFISQAVDLLLQNKPDDVAVLYRTYAERIQNRQIPTEDFARRERVTEKTFTSSAKKRLAEAIVKAKVGEYVMVYEKHDGSIGLADNYANDEDTDYLLDKLYKFASRIKEAFGDDFDRLFPKPSKKTKMEAAGQQTLEF